MLISYFFWLLTTIIEVLLLIGALLVRSAALDGDELSTLLTPAEQGVVIRLLTVDAPTVENSASLSSVRVVTVKYLLPAAKASFLFCQDH